MAETEAEKTVTSVETVVGDGGDTPPRAALSDTGNVRRLLAREGHHFRWVPKWGRFMVWDGRAWVPDVSGSRMLGLTAKVLDDLKAELKSLPPEDGRRDALRKWLHESQSVGRRKAIVELVKGEPEAEAAPDDFDANPWLLNVANGTLDLRRGADRRLRKFSPADRITVTATGARYDGAAKAPRWAAFLEEVLPDPEVRAFVQRYVGYSLTGNTNERMLMVCVGEGANGKSVFLRVLSDLLGPYARTADPELLVARGAEPHPTNLADLAGRRLVTLSELRQGRVWDEEKLKRLTGGSDTIKCRRMYEDFWEYRPQFKLVMAANDKPKAYDSGAAFWSRMAVVPWPIVVPPERQDKQLVDKLEQELPGILNWALEGCHAWQEGGLRVPEAVREAADEYRDDEDRVGQFIEEMLVFDEAARMSNAELSALARRWCEQHNIKPFSERTVGDRLVRGGGRAMTPMTLVPKRYRSMSERGIVGVRAKKSSDSAKKEPN